MPYHKHAPSEEEKKQKLEYYQAILADFRSPRVSIVSEHLQKLQDEVLKRLELDPNTFRVQDALQISATKFLMMVQDPSFFFQHDPYNYFKELVKDALGLSIHNFQPAKRQQKYTLDDFIDMQDLIHVYDDQLSEKEFPVDDSSYLERLRNALISLTDKTKQEAFIKEILSRGASNSEFDDTLNGIIIAAFNAGLTQKINTKADIGRAQAIENADNHAIKIYPKVREIIEQGASTLEELASGLNEAGIMTKNGNHWQTSSVNLLLDRLNKLRPDTPLSLNKDAFLHKMSAVIKELQIQGASNPSSLAKALNDQNIPTKNGGKWHPSTVTQLLNKIEDQGKTSPSRTR